MSPQGNIPKYLYFPIGPSNALAFIGIYPNICLFYKPYCLT